MKWIVTGASRGIGRATAELLLARGDDVLLVARDAVLLRDVAGAAPTRAHVLPLDLDGEGAASRVVDAARAAMGGIDGLVAAAGVVRYASALTVTDEELARLHRSCFLSPTLLSLAVARELVAHETPGAVVHVGSTLASVPARNTLAYAAAKAALVSATRSLALELAPHGIRVNAVAPGVVDTDMVRVPRLAPGEVPPTGAEREARIERELAALRALHPLGRLGEPRDVARTILHLLDATWITGSVVVVDGGLSLGAG